MRYKRVSFDKALEIMRADKTSFFPIHFKWSESYKGKYRQDTIRLFGKWIPVVTVDAGKVTWKTDGGIYGFEDKPDTYVPC